MIVKLLTEHHLEFLSLKVGCTGSSESTLVKMSNCWKSHDTTHIIIMPMVSYVSGVAIGAGSNSAALGSVANNTSSSTTSTSVPPTVNSGEPIGGGGVNNTYQSPLILTESFEHNLINVSYLTACYLYQVMMALHFLRDVANDAESTQNSKITS